MVKARTYEVDLSGFFPRFTQSGWMIVSEKAVDDYNKMQAKAHGLSGSYAVVGNRHTSIEKLLEEVEKRKQKKR